MHLFYYSSPSDTAPTDGGYDSRTNREAMAAGGSPHWNMAAHKGAPSRYELALGADGALVGVL